MNRALQAIVLSLLLAAAPAQSAEKKVSAGKSYGANIFAGLLTGALIGAAVGALPYAVDRHNQDAQSVIYGALYGSVAGGGVFAIPLSAYEVASDKPGAGTTVLFDMLGFGVLGGIVGGAGGMISYRRKLDYDPSSGEDFLAAAAAGVCGGALVGLGVGIVEAVIWDGPQRGFPKGKGIHASVGLLAFSPVRPQGEGHVALPNATLGEVRF